MTLSQEQEKEVLNVKSNEMKDRYEFQEQVCVGYRPRQTSSRAILFNHQGHVITLAQKTFQQYFPKPGWVEHDPNEIWYTQSSAIKEAMAKADIVDAHIACIGIANQRETTLVWDRGDRISGL